MLNVIGNMIAQLRNENSISIEELSRRSGVSIDKIKEIEASRTTPSITTILRLSRVLGSRISNFDGQESILSHHTGNDQLVISRAQDLSQIELDGHSLHYLEHLAGNDAHLEPLIINLVRGSEPYDMSLHCGDGELFAYVLEGQIEIHYPQDTDLTTYKVHSLNQGDSATYQADHVHYILNSAESLSRVLLVASRQL